MNDKTTILNDLAAARRTIADAHAALGRVAANIDARWPEPQSTKTLHLVLVSYSSAGASLSYLAALRALPDQLNAWLRPQGLGLSACKVHFARLVGPPGGYGLRSLVAAVNVSLGTDYPNEDNALYLFSQDYEMELALYGTLGGDVFGKPQFPGVSFFMVQGLHALAYDATYPAAAAKGETWTRTKALRAIAHELGHNFCGLPCADAPHAYPCIMKYWWLDQAVYEDGGYVYTKNAPPFTAGNEREALIASGFMVRT